MYSIRQTKAFDFKAGDKPRISVIVPVFNASRYLNCCIKSLLQQTLKNIECIFVDDGSTDDSRAIIEKYAMEDSRVLGIFLKKNLGAFMARKTGVLAANAQYVTFLDPDDTLSVGACDLLVKMMDKTSATIGHGGMEIINKNNLAKERIDAVEKMVQPQFEHLEGDSIIQAMAIDGKINPGLCGKVFKTLVIKHANEMIPDGRYVRAQDYLVTFVVCCMADKYVSIPQNVYRYGYGQGVYGAKKRDINYYKTICSQVDILPPLRKVVEAHFSEKANIVNALHVAEDKLIGGSYAQIFSVLTSLNDRKEAFSFLLSKVGGMRLTEFLAKRNYGNKENLALVLDSLGAVPRSKAKCVRKVGIFYYHLTPGGVQRVISTLILTYKCLGCEVVIFLEKRIDCTCFEIDPDVTIEYLPVVGAMNRNEIASRLHLLVSAIKRHGIDLMYYHAFLGPNLLWDLLACKWVLNIPFVVHYHTATCFRPRVAKEYYSRWPGFMKIFSFADVVIVLSRADEKMLCCGGVNAKYIPNPIPPDFISRTVKFDDMGKKEIVWVSRFSREKCPSDPVKILALVRKCLPDVKLTIVGGGPEVFLTDVKKTVTELNLTGEVTIAGEQKDVKPYYQRASVYLHTSNLEGFPMSILEAAATGLPIVMYALPWLEIVRDNDGVVQVPQADLNSAAAAIVSILSSPEKVMTMSKANLERVKKFSSYDFANAWKSIFLSVQNGNTFCDTANVSADDNIALLSQIEHCYARGIMEEQEISVRCDKERMRLSNVIQEQNTLRDKLKSEIVTLKQEQNALRDKLKSDIVTLKSNLRNEQRKCDAFRLEVLSIKSSEAYRTGMAVTWPARKIWGGIKCLNENGVKYTAKHVIGKILRLFRVKNKW